MKIHTKLLFLVFGMIISCVFADDATERVDVIGLLKKNDVLNNFDLIPPNAKASLDGGSYTATLRKDGSFIIYDVQPGSYLLEILVPGFIFPKTRIDVVGKQIKAYPRIMNNPWDSKSSVMEYPPLELAAMSRMPFFLTREGFSIMSLFKNPMMLMMFVSLGFVFVLPRIAKNIDPEMLKELQNEQAPASGGGGSASQVPKIENPFEDLSKKLANMFAGASASSQSQPSRRR